MNTTKQMWERIDALRQSCPNEGWCDEEETECPHCHEAYVLHEAITALV